jgi:hypothetical protein
LPFVVRTALIVGRRIARGERVSRQVPRRAVCSWISAGYLRDALKLSTFAE